MIDKPIWRDLRRGAHRLRSVKKRPCRRDDHRLPPHHVAASCGSDSGWHGRRAEAFGSSCADQHTRSLRLFALLSGQLDSFGATHLVSGAAE